MRARKLPRATRSRPRGPRSGRDRMCLLEDGQPWSSECGTVGHLGFVDPGAQVGLRDGGRSPHGTARVLEAFLGEITDALLDRSHGLVGVLEAIGHRANYRPRGAR